MKRLEDLFTGADFSKETNFKDVLRTRLFGEGAGSGISAMQRLSYDDMELVNAAGEANSNFEVEIKE